MLKWWRWRQPVPAPVVQLMSSHFTASDCSRAYYDKGKMTLQEWSCTALSNPSWIRVEGLRKTGTISGMILGLQAQIPVPYHPPAVYTTRRSFAFLTASIITGSMYVQYIHTWLVCCVGQPGWWGERYDPWACWPLTLSWRYFSGRPRWNYNVSCRFAGAFSEFWGAPSLCCGAMKTTCI